MSAVGPVPFAARNARALAERTLSTAAHLVTDLHLDFALRDALGADTPEAAQARVARADAIIAEFIAFRAHCLVLAEG